MSRILINTTNNPFSLIDMLELNLLRDTGKAYLFTPILKQQNSLFDEKFIKDRETNKLKLKLIYDEKIKRQIVKKPPLPDFCLEGTKKGKKSGHISKINILKAERYKTYAYGDFRGINDKLILIEYSPNNLSTLKIYVIQGLNAYVNEDTIINMFLSGAFKEDIDKLCLTSV